MVSDQQQKTALELLDDVIIETVSHISDFTKNPSDFTRNRMLNADTTIKVTLNAGGQTLNTEMINAFPVMEDRASTSAYEQQKAKLTPELFGYIFDEYNKTANRHNLLNDKYMVFAIDGSDFNPPYQSKSKYVVPVPSGRKRKDGEPTKPYSQLHGNILFNIMDRTYEDIVIQPRSEMDERSAAIEMLHNLHPEHPFIVIMDRGYDGFNMIENCNHLDNGYYIIRTKAGIGGAIREIANLPDKECDVEMTFRCTTSGHYFKQHKDEEKNLHLIKHFNNRHKKEYSKYTRDQRWDFGQFVNVKCRVCKFRINNPDTGKQEWEVLVTNLNRFEFPLKKMKDMYHLRWDIETSFRELKYALSGISFHSRKDDFVEMELYSHLIMFNVVSRTINAVNVPQSDTCKYEYVVSFKDAVTIVRKYFRLYCKDPPNKIYTEILGYTRPLVSGRADVRNMKPKTAIWFVYRIA